MVTFASTGQKAFMRNIGVHEDYSVSTHHVHQLDRTLTMAKSRAGADCWARFVAKGGGMQPDRARETLGAGWQHPLLPSVDSGLPADYGCSGTTTQAAAGGLAEEQPAGGGARACGSPQAVYGVHPRHW